jgi:hypothetical protein
MGEQKRKTEHLSPVDKAALELTRKLANEGRLLEGGFAAYVVTSKIGIDDPALPKLRDAYMSAAEHLWSSIMATRGGRRRWPISPRRWRRKGALEQ